MNETNITINPVDAINVTNVTQTVNGLAKSQSFYIIVLVAAIIIAIIIGVKIKQYKNKKRQNANNPFPVIGRQENPQIVELPKAAIALLPSSKVPVGKTIFTNEDKSMLKNLLDKQMIEFCSAIETLKKLRGKLNES